MPRIALPLDANSPLPPSLTLAVREALESEEAFRPLGDLLVDWSPRNCLEGKPATYTRRLGTPVITLHPRFLELAGQGCWDAGWSVANRLARTPGEWAALTFLHEIGHHRMRERWPRRSEGEAAATILPQLSYYAGKSLTERFAEAYAWWRAGQRLPGDAEAVLRDCAG